MNSQASVLGPFVHIQCESLNSECEALKEKVEKLTIDLEIMKNEINESGTKV